MVNAAGSQRSTVTHEFLRVGAVEGVTAALAEVSLQLLVDLESGAVQTAAGGVENDGPLRLELLERDAVCDAVRLRLQIGLQAYDDAGPLDLRAGVVLHGVVLLTGAQRRLLGDLVGAFPAGAG